MQIKLQHFTFEAAWTCFDIEVIINIVQ